MQPISDSPEELIAFSSRIIDNDRIDGGIAKMTSYENADPFTIVDLGQITGVYDITFDNLGDKVVKRGRTSGITIGVIDYVFVTIIDKKDQKMCIRDRCITDGDFAWGLGNSAKTLSEYKAHVPAHVSNLNSTFVGATNVRTVIQKSYGSTFEDDLFMCNIGNSKVSKALLKIALPVSLHTFKMCIRDRYYLE